MSRQEERVASENAWATDNMRNGNHILVGALTVGTGPCGRGGARSLGSTILGLALAGVLAPAADAMPEAHLTRSLGFHAQAPKGYRRVRSASAAGVHRETWRGNGMRLDAEVVIRAQVSHAWDHYEKARRGGPMTQNPWRDLPLVSEPTPGKSQQTIGRPGKILHIRENVFASVTSSSPLSPAKGTALYALAADLLSRIQWQEHAIAAIAYQSIDDGDVPAGFRRTDQWASMESLPGSPRILTVEWERGSSRIRIRVEYFNLRTLMLERMSGLFPGLISDERPSDEAVTTMYRTKTVRGRSPENRYLIMAPLQQALVRIDLIGRFRGHEPDRLALALAHGIKMTRKRVAPVPRSYLVSRPKTEDRYANFLLKEFPQAAPFVTGEGQGAEGTTHLQPHARSSGEISVWGLALGLCAIAGTGVILWLRARWRNRGAAQAAEPET